MPQRLPRTRGDGPHSTIMEEDACSAPPHARGWTLPLHLGVARERGSPARAGMDRALSSAARGAGGLPRTRGDGPPPVGRVVAVPRAPPHARGWTRRMGACCGSPGGSPARAGMDPVLTDTQGTVRWLPRTRGDGPLVQIHASCGITAPPHARGWTSKNRARADGVSGSPARAGMDRTGGGRRVWCRGLPRTRGDGPVRRDRLVGGEGAPPHARGWTRKWGSASRPVHGSPARAGMDRRRNSLSSAERRLPRTRGDGPISFLDTSLGVSAPPHARGWTGTSRASPRPAPGSPARAGMDPRASGCRAPGRRLPRTRGDGPHASGRLTVLALAPPHARGWTRFFKPVHLCLRGSPARAGMDRRSTPSGSPARWLPRTRGDGP